MKVWKGALRDYCGKEISVGMKARKEFLEKGLSLWLMWETMRTLARPAPAKMKATGHMWPLGICYRNKVHIKFGD